MADGESFWELLRRRRMVRDYLPDPIDTVTIEKIVGTVRRAPSGGFSQGHRLVVVTDAGMRGALADLAGEAEYVAMGHKPWISTGPGSHRRVHPGGELPRALPQGRKARRWRGDLVAGPLAT